jgi:hypothetical protein
MVITALRRPSPADIRGPPVTRLNPLDRDCAAKLSELICEFGMKAGADDPTTYFVFDNFFPHVMSAFTRYVFACLKFEIEVVERLVVSPMHVKREHLSR